jgi:phosphate transport system permease protein
MRKLLKPLIDGGPQIILIRAVAVLALIPFALIVMDVAIGGANHISWGFISQAPSHSGRGGGVFPILVSTVLILSVTLAVVVPFGLAAAIFLSEFMRKKGVFAKVVGISLDVLAGIPSIIFGLFGNAFFSVYLGLGYSILSGGLTLACMALPIFVRSAEVGLSNVPEDWRKGALALGMSSSSLFWHIMLPGAGRAIAVGLVLSVGRTLAETAALLYTSGYVYRMPDSLLDSGRALSVHIYDLSMNVPGGEPNAYASMLVLILLIGTSNGLSYFLTENLLRRGVMEP